MIAPIERERERAGADASTLRRAWLVEPLRREVCKDRQPESCYTSRSDHIVCRKYDELSFCLLLPAVIFMIYFIVDLL